jgi:hypothetical protein
MSVGPWLMRLPMSRARRSHKLCRRPRAIVMHHANPIGVETAGASCHLDHRPQFSSAPRFTRGDGTGRQVIGRFIGCYVDRPISSTTVMPRGQRGWIEQAEGSAGHRRCAGAPACYAFLRGTREHRSSRSSRTLGRNLMGNATRGQGGRPHSLLPNYPYR